MLVTHAASEGTARELSAAVREDVLQFLYQEAELLDQGRFEQWLDLLTEDVTYRMPVRLTRERSDKPDYSDLMEHFDEDRRTLELRVKRLQTDFAWAEDPPSRTRRFVSNVRVAPGEHDGEVAVRSYILVYRNRGDAPDADLISGERRDVLVQRAERLKLRRRTIFVDQATIGTRNLGIFL